MPTEPIISIVTVCRNDYAALRKTWESLKNQNRYDLIQWIVIDGASDDETPEFLVSLNDEHFRPTFWSSLPDEGLYDAMNKGIAQADAFYVMFLNAGDTLADELTIDFLAHTITKFGADFVYGDSFEQTQKGAVRYKKSRHHEHTKYGLFTHHQAMLYKRESIDALRYNTAYKIAADYDFTLRFLEQTESVHYLPEPLSIFAAGGISQKNAKLGRLEQFEIRQKHNLVEPFENHMISMLQLLNLNFRKFLPALYWAMKEKR